VSPRRLLGLVALCLSIALATPAEGGRGTGPQSPFARIKKAGARVAIVQGSFDWVHNGHLELMERALLAKDAEGKSQFDHIVVMPTRSYEKKPFLRGSWARRVALLKAAIAEHPALRDRVIVSTAHQDLPNTPAQLLHGLHSGRPDLELSYVLGADSFNESKAWPGFSTLGSIPGFRLAVVGREGHAIEDTARAHLVLAPAKTKISSTAIRQALDEGDLSSIAHAVPKATLVALEQELARRELERKAGDRLLPGPRRSYKSFATLERERPAKAVDLLEGADEEHLPDDVREHMASVQERLHAAHTELAGAQLSVSAKGIDPRKGHTQKLIVLRKRAGKIAGQYLFKRLSAVDAKKVESMTLLANLLGVPTPVAIPHTLTEKGSRYTASEGVLVPWVGGLETSLGHDFAKMDPKVNEALIVSRWFNEVIGNQDVWWGQFLRPKAKGQRNREILNIDFDAAFIKRDAREVQKVLKEHFGIDRPLEDTAWTDKKFDFDGKVGWSPEHYDSKHTMYGPLLAAYVTGKIDLDMNRIKAQLRAAQRVPKSAIRQAMSGYLDKAGAEHWGQIPVQAAERFVPRDEFMHKLEQRIERSVDEFCAFLDELARARQNPRHQLAKFYRSLGPAW
jgi:nicotinic acid mononucleotide adenylyltransferase